MTHRPRCPQPPANENISHAIPGITLTISRCPECKATSVTKEQP